MASATYSSHAMNHKLTGSMVALNRKANPTLEYGSGSTNSPSRLPIRNGTRRRSLSATRSVSLTATSRMLADERLSLNVGGVRFQTLRSTLAREPHTTLGELARNTPVFADDHQKQDYYFDRSSTMFDYVLNYYRTGELHFPHNFCPSVVKQELEFWNIDGKEMQDCCWKRYLKFVQREKDAAMVEQMVPEIFERSRNRQREYTGRRSRKANYYVNENPDPSGFLQDLTTSHSYVYSRLLLSAMFSTIHEFGVYLILLGCISLLCSLLLMLTERNTGINGPLGALWVGWVTMTTLGYGDTFPLTTAGCVLMMVCTLTGIMIFTAPLPLIARRFHYYRELVDEALLVVESEEVDVQSKENGKIK